MVSGDRTTVAGGLLQKGHGEFVREIELFHSLFVVVDIQLFDFVKTCRTGASLVAQWLRICLPMQGTRV